MLGGSVGFLLLLIEQININIYSEKKAKEGKKDFYQSFRLVIVWV